MQLTVPYLDHERDRAKDDSASLVARARDGDREAFRFIFDRYSRPILRFISALIADWSIAEELTQETFVRAYRGLGSFRDDARLPTWLFSIARNVALEAIRVRRRDRNRFEINDHILSRVKETRQQPDAEFLTKELNAVLRSALQALNIDQRIVFVLKVMHQRSYGEIAEITGCSIPKLKTDLYRAKAEMRLQIRPYLEARR